MTLGQLVVGLNEVDQTLVHVDVAAHRRERVDVGIADDFDRIRNVVPGAFGPQFVRDALDVRIEKRVVFDDHALDDLLILGATHLNLLLGGDG